MPLTFILLLVIVSFLCCDASSEVGNIASTEARINKGDVCDCEEDIKRATTQIQKNLDAEMKVMKDSTEHLRNTLYDSEEKRKNADHMVMDALSNLDAEKNKCKHEIVASDERVKSLEQEILKKEIDIQSLNQMLSEMKQNEEKKETLYKTKDSQCNIQVKQLEEKLSTSGADQGKVLNKALSEMKKNEVEKDTLHKTKQDQCDNEVKQIEEKLAMSKSDQGNLQQEFQMLQLKLSDMEKNHDESNSIHKTKHDDLSAQIKKLQEKLITSESERNESFQAQHVATTNLERFKKEREREVADLKKVLKEAEISEEKWKTSLRQANDLQRELKRDVTTLVSELERRESEAQKHFCNTTLIVSDFYRRIEQLKTGSQRWLKPHLANALKKGSSLSAQVKDSSIQLGHVTSRNVNLVRAHSGRFYETEMRPRVGKMNTVVEGWYRMYAKDIVDEHVLPLYTNQILPVTTKIKMDLEPVTTGIKTNARELAESLHLFAISFFEEISRASLDWIHSKTKIDNTNHDEENMQVTLLKKVVPLFVFIGDNATRIVHLFEKILFIFVLMSLLKPIVRFIVFALQTVFRMLWFFCPLRIILSFRHGKEKVVTKQKKGTKKKRGNHGTNKSNGKLS